MEGCDFEASFSDAFKESFKQAALDKYNMSGKSDIDKVIERAAQYAMASGEVLFSAGDVGTELFIVASVSWHA